MRFLKGLVQLLPLVVRAEQASREIIQDHSRLGVALESLNQENPRDVQYQQSNDHGATLFRTLAASIKKETSAALSSCTNRLCMPIPTFILLGEI